MRTVWPTLSWPLSFSVTVKFAYSVDRSVSDTICVPAVRNWPTSTVTHAEFAVERRAHQFLRNDRFGLGDAGIGLVVRGLRLIHRRLRTELARRELLGPIQRQFRDRRLRLEIGEIALIRTVEQLHQRRSRLHGEPALNMMSVMRPLTSEVTLT